MPRGYPADHPPTAQLLDLPVGVCGFQKFAWRSPVVVAPVDERLHTIMDDESTWSMATLASELISLSRTQADRRNNPLLVLQEAVDKVERFKSSPRAYSFLGRSSLKTPSSPLYLQETTPSTTAAITPTSPPVTSPWKYQAPTGYDSSDSDDDCMVRFVVFSLCVVVLDPSLLFRSPSFLFSTAWTRSQVPLL